MTIALWKTVVVIVINILLSASIIAFIIISHYFLYDTTATAITIMIITVFAQKSGCYTVKSGSSCLYIKINCS